MSRAWDDERRRLLDHLVRMGDAGRAEGAGRDRLARGFYPVPEHLRLLDPDVVLVVGPRGSGKSQIAKLLTEADLAEPMARFAPRVRLPREGRWLEAYPGGRDMFEANGLRDLVAEYGSDAALLRDVWMAYLLRRLQGELRPEHQQALSTLWAPPAADIAAVHQAFRALAAAPVVALDDLDRDLEQRSQHLFVTYDELDTLGHGDWSVIEAGVQGLVSFWAAYTRRWRHLRAKLFLRTDLYERHARIGGADLYKLAAGRVELNWGDRDLYAMLLKRLANADDELALYLKSVKGIEWQQDAELGLIPRLQRWDDARPVIERMVGPYMGSDKKKGLVYRWLLDHVRDGMGRAYPRPLVQLIEQAAQYERQQAESLAKPRLLQPTSLRRALDGVSMDHVRQASHEWPWLEVLKRRLASNPLVPYPDSEAVRLLQDIAQAELWSAQAAVVPPYDGKELLAYLIELGILRRRPDQRIDAPDLFLTGLGLRRKGGVLRKR
ncbi:MAG: hypothetical protein AB3X44_18275 [Leptothrix sp. (in: b-proteobacteria)]